MCFRPLALAAPARAATENAAILTLQRLSRPAAREKAGDVSGGKLPSIAQTPTFKLAGNRVSLAHTAAACVHFEDWQSTVNAISSKTRPHMAVKGRFEGWRFTLNSSTSNTRPHTAVELPFSPGGAREGWGESGGCSARIATSLIASCAVPARAGGTKPIQRPCGNRLQKLQRLVHSRPPPGRKRVWDQSWVEAQELLHSRWLLTLLPIGLAR